MKRIGFVLLLVSIAITIALYRVFLKLIQIDKLLSISLQWLFIFLFWLVLFFLFGSGKFEHVDFKDLVYISLAWIVLTLNSFLIMIAFRMRYKLSVFTPAYAILGNVFAVLIWYLFF